MLIGIDGNEANISERVGIGEYAFELLRQFYETQKSKVKTQNYPLRSEASNSKFKIYLKNKPVGDLPGEEDWWQYNVFGPNKLWTQFALPLNLYFGRPRPDVFFSPTHYAPRFSPVPTVISVMDLSYLHFPEMFKSSDLYQLKNWTKYSIRKAKKIFTISQASKDDIIKVYNVAESKVVVTYPGIKFQIPNSKFQINSKLEMQNSKLLKEKYKIEGDYILFVGTLQPRKNIVRLIEAFSHVKKGYSQASPDQNDMQLIIVGKKGWLYNEILEAPKKFSVEDKVNFLDFVPNEDLSLFYQNAVCFVLPSLYEGFGLPVLEAMKWGCAVITSNVSSLPEAGGDAALYVDPENVDDIFSKMQLLLKNDKLRREMIEKGYKQVKKFSWEKTARETLSVLEEVAKT